MNTTTVETDRSFVLAAYILHLVGAITGIASVVGLVINYLKRNLAPEPLDSHHRWMIRSFWWAILWCVIGAITTLILIGWAILGLTWLWYIYRHIRGLVGLINGEPLPR